LVASSRLPDWWAKVQRAQEHFDALDRLVSETFAIEANIPRLGVKIDPETTQHVLYINRCPDFGPLCIRLGLIVGDVLTNLNSALDYLLYDRSFVNGANDADWVKWEREIKFPIIGNPHDWLSILGKQLKYLTASQQACVKRFQPFDRRDFQQLNHAIAGPPFHPLQMLRDLTNKDKHRLLTTVIIPMWGGHGAGDNAELAGVISMLGVAQGTAPDWLGGAPAKLNAEMARAYLPTQSPKHEVDVAGYLSPRVALTEPAKRPLGPVIERIMAFVIKAIRELEEAL
jgi:hypothetical protein